MDARTVVLTVLAVVLAALVVLVLQVLRRLQQLRRGGVDVDVRPAPTSVVVAAADDPRGWRSGIARYRGDQFRWYRISGLGTAPTVVFDRTEIEIVDRRPGWPSEQRGSSTVLRCRVAGGVYELAMAPDVLTGFSSWLEATPPGRTTGYRQAS